MLNVQECCLCSQIDGRQENDLIARLLPDQPYVRRVMLESRWFAAMPSLGPLVRGHSLLCPTWHTKSFAEIDDRLHREYYEVKKALQTILAELYGAAVHIFEHGAAAHGDRPLCTVDHAHLHFVPLPRTFDVNAIEQAGWLRFDGGLHTLRRLTKGREYISYETPDGIGRLLLAHEGTFESQHMRKVLARGLGYSDRWNWREVPDARAADEAWRSFVGFDADRLRTVAGAVMSDR